MTLPPSRRLCVLVCCFWSLSTACTHVVARPMPCPDQSNHESGRSALAWERGSAVIPVSGSVSRIAPFEPLISALVDLVRVESNGSSRMRRVISTDSTGRFAFDSIAPGRYVLRIRRIGFGVVSDTIEVRQGGSVTARAVLAMDRVMLDHCGYVMTMKRVPWWIRK